MAGEVRDYVAEDFLITLGGVRATGLGPSDFLSIEEEGDGITDSQGIDREITRSRSRSKRATVTLTLSMSSPFNKVLNAAYELDKEVGNLVPFTVIDPNGSVNLITAKAWVTKRPTAGFNKGADGTRAWVIKTGECQSLVIGGLAEL